MQLKRFGRLSVNEYSLVYADPPWQVKKSGLRKSRPNQGKSLDYKTITCDEIKIILSNYSNAKVFFIWTVDKYLHECESIMKSFGYKLHSRIIWDKLNGIAPAFTVRFSHEYLLWFYRSPMEKISIDQRGKWSTVLKEKSTKHSKKPSIAYEFIESLYPNLSKIELFARSYREGWWSMGDELKEKAKGEK